MKFINKSTGRKIRFWQRNKLMMQMMKAIEDINQKATETIKIIKIADDIALQTKILAINVALQATRAEHMEGSLGVLAEEAGNVAKTSAEATQITTALITEMVEAVKNGVEVVEDI